MVVTNGDLVPDLLGPFLGGELQIPILLLRGRICRIGNLAPGSEREFHSFQQSMRVQWAITSSLCLWGRSEVELFEDVENGE